MSNIIFEPFLDYKPTSKVQRLAIEAKFLHNSNSIAI